VVRGAVGCVWLGQHVGRVVRVGLELPGAGSGGLREGLGWCQAPELVGRGVGQLRIMLPIMPPTVPAAAPVAAESPEAWAAM
jgi:hypothetical protein